jgi:hypothetical protein
MGTRKITVCMLKKFLKKGSELNRREFNVLLVIHRVV